MPQARFEITDYSARVLDVIKGKFGLKNRSEALNRFILENGSEFVELTPNPEFLKYLDNAYEQHIKKYGQRKMNIKELDKLLDLD